MISTKCSSYESILTGGLPWELVFICQRARQHRVREQQKSSLPATRTIYTHRDSFGSYSNDNSAGTDHSKRNPILRFGAEHQPFYGGDIRCVATRLFLLV